MAKSKKLNQFDIIKMESWTAPEKIDGPDPRILTMPNVPDSLHGQAPRTLLGNATWTKMRKRCYYDADYTCEACGKDLHNETCHAHELYSYDFVECEAKFERCVCLCPQCVDAETEVLTEDGWKKIPYITTQDKVACFDKNDESIKFMHPSATISSYKDKAVKITGNGATLYFSEDHRLPLRVKGGRENSDRRNTITDVLAGGYKATHYYNWILSGENKRDEHLTAAERVYIAVEADGHLAYDKENPKGGTRQRDYNSRYGSEDYRFTYHIALMKSRKIERLKALLETSGLLWSVAKSTSNNYCEFNIWSNLDLKHFANCFDINMGEQKAMEFIEELVFWDGTFSGQQANWYTNKKEEVDFVQAVACQTNVRTTVSVVNRIGNLRKGEWKTPYDKLTYSVNFQSIHTEVTARSMKREDIEWNDKMYCLSVPTTYFVARRDGFVFVTGNCHLLCIHTGRALSLYRKHNPMYQEKQLLDGAEHSFKLISEWNKSHSDDELIKLYSTFVSYIDEPRLREPMEKLIEKYNITFYSPVPSKKEFGAWRLKIGNKWYDSKYKSREEWQKAMDINNKSVQETNDRLKDSAFDRIMELMKEKDEA